MAAIPAPPALNREHLARIIVDAIDMGDKLAAQNSGVSVRSVQRYRQRLHTDPELATLVAEKRKAAADIAEDAWRRTRIRFLRSAVAKLEQLADQATPQQMRALAGAIKIVGDLHLVGGALSEGEPVADGEQSAPDQQGSRSKATAGNASEGTAEVSMH